ncbi:hypothetical protein TELCIR_09658, partial [Teladorsagia circumcincta]
FPNPRNCSKCVCPGGYGGDHCNERPKGDCGRTIEASPEWNTLTDILGDVSVLKPLQDFTVCNYWINSPPETEIEIILLSFSNSFDVDGCVYDGVEIKANQDQRLSGYRFCSRNAAGTTLRSYTNRVPVITWNRLYRSEMSLLYRYVSSSEPRPAARTIRPLPNHGKTTTELPLPADFETSGGAVPFPDDFWTTGEAARQCVDHPE